MRGGSSGRRGRCLMRGARRSSGCAEGAPLAADAGVAVAVARGGAVAAAEPASLRLLLSTLCHFEAPAPVGMPPAATASAAIAASLVLVAPHSASCTARLLSTLPVNERCSTRGRAAEAPVLPVRMGGGCTAVSGSSLQESAPRALEADARLWAGVVLAGVCTLTAAVVRPARMLAAAAENVPPSAVAAAEAQLGLDGALKPALTAVCVLSPSPPAVGVAAVLPGGDGCRSSCSSSGKVAVQQGKGERAGTKQGRAGRAGQCDAGLAEEGDSQTRSHA